MKSNSKIFHEKTNEMERTNLTVTGGVSDARKRNSLTCSAIDSKDKGNSRKSIRSEEESEQKEGRIRKRELKKEGTGTASTRKT